MGGGGGGDDYSAKQAEIEAKKQRARNALNVSFGVAPTAIAQPERGGVAGAIADAQFGEPAQPGVDTSMVDEAAKNKAAREALYSGVRDNAFTAGKRGFDERKTSAARNNKFALFAQGLNGGSVDVDESALLDRTYNEGLLNLGAKADAAKTDVMNSDEQTRLQLLQSIDAGMDESSAVSSALGQLKVNSDRATANAQGTSLGDLFGDAGLLYTKTQAARGAQRASMDDPYGFFARSKPRVSNAGASGTISNQGV